MQEMRVLSLGQDNTLEKENGYPLQYSCLGNPMDNGAWWDKVCGVTKSQTQLHNYVLDKLPPAANKLMFTHHSASVSHNALCAHTSEGACENAASEPAGL